MYRLLIALLVSLGFILSAPAMAANAPDMTTDEPVMAAGEDKDEDEDENAGDEMRLSQAEPPADEDEDEEDEDEDATPGM